MKPMQDFEPAIGFVAPDGTLTEKGRALNQTGREYVMACWRELAADMPRPATSRNSVFGSDPHIKPKTETESAPLPMWMERIMDTPETEIEWLLDGVLPMAGMSLCGAAPKVGKTTLGRCLALAVSRGVEFIGRRTVAGTVLYIALEDSPRQIRKHMAAIGASREDRIGWYGHGDFPATTGERLNTLDAVIQEFAPVLVVIDPLFKFVSIKDGDAYAEVSAALNPLMQIARRTGVHILLTHHNRKGGGEAGEEVLGSTALFAGVDTLISLKRDGEGRTVETIQREGDDLPATVLRMDPTGWIDAGGIRAEIKAREIDEQILAVIGEAGQPMETGDVIETTARTKKAVLDSLRRLTETGALTQTGHGKRNAPYLYSVPKIL